MTKKNFSKKILTIVLSSKDKQLFQKSDDVIINYLNSLDITAFKKNSLDEYMACDYIFTDEKDLISHKGMFRRLGNMPIDFCLQYQATRKKKLLLADMDGTIIENETLNDIARFLGKGDQVKKITDLGKKGRLDFSTSLANRVGLLKGLKINSLEEAKKNVTFIKGASSIFSSLSKNNIKTVLVTGGFKPISTFVKDKLKIDDEISNTFGIEGDRFNGKVYGSVVDASYKEIILKRYKEKIKLDSSEVVAIGDAANDLNMLLSAGLAIAYKATDVVKANIDNQINYTDLTSVLYFLGIKSNKK